MIKENLSFEGWNIWAMIKGRKKFVITIVGLFCTNFAFNPELAGLLAGGVVFEGVWGIIEYFFKSKELN